MGYTTVIAFGLMSCGPLDGHAQRRIDLRGRPIAAIAQPFSAISDGAELASGAFVFVDSRENLVHRVNITKGEVVDLGREGEGPNEFRLPAKAIPDGQGGALILDPRLGRALKVNGNGAISGAVLPINEFGRPPASIRGTDSSGRVIRYGSARHGEPLPIERWDPTDRHVDTLGWYPQQEVMTGRAVRRGDETVQELSLPKVWSPRVDWDVVPNGGVVIVYPDPFHIEIVNPDGKRVVGPPLDFSPIRVTEAERRAYRSERGPVPDNIFPEFKPPFEGANSVHVSPDGLIWIRRLRRWDEAAALYDVVDAHGVRVAQATLRPNSNIAGFGSGRRVYVARRNPNDGLMYLELYQY